MNQKVAQALSAQFQFKMTEAVETLYQARLAQKRREAALANAERARADHFADRDQLSREYFARLPEWQGKSWYTGV
jgi:hypothetical protein